MKLLILFLIAGCGPVDMADKCLPVQRSLDRCNAALEHIEIERDQLADRESQEPVAEE